MQNFKSSPPIRMMKKGLGEVLWREKEKLALASLEEALPTLKKQLTSDAWLGLGIKLRCDILLPQSALRMCHVQQCFERPIVFSSHAKNRMIEREICEEMLLEVIDSGDTRYKDTPHLWAFKEFPERHDNLLCAVVVLEDRAIVKTVMHHFSVL
jgi:hypothetical protein